MKFLPHRRPDKQPCPNLLIKASKRSIRLKLPWQVWVNPRNIDLWKPYLGHIIITKLILIFHWILLSHSWRWWGDAWNIWETWVRSKMFVKSSIRKQMVHHLIEWIEWMINEGSIGTGVWLYWWFRRNWRIEDEKAIKRLRGRRMMTRERRFSKPRWNTRHQNRCHFLNTNSLGGLPSCY